jgi:hypothetical protein
MASRSSAGRSFVRMMTLIGRISDVTSITGGAPVIVRSALNGVVRSSGNSTT